MINRLGNGRLLIISMQKNYGGGEVFLGRLVALIKHEFNISCLIANAALGKQLSCLGNEVSLISAHKLGRYLDAILAIFKLRKKNQSITIYLNGNSEVVLAPVLKFLSFNVICVRHTQLRNDNFMESIKSYVWLYCVKNADSIICVSKFIEKQLASCSTLKAKTILMRSWVSDSFIRNDSRISHGNSPLEKRDLKIGVVARLDRLKGHLQVFEACRGVSNLSIHLAGEGPDKRLFQASSKGLQVFYQDFQSEICGFLDGVDVQILMSQYEGGNPLSLIEGMARGLPCIASNIPSIAEIIDHMETGLLVDPGDIVALKNAIIYLRDNESERNRIGENARLFISRSRAAKVVGVNYVDLIKNAIDS